MAVNTNPRLMVEQRGRRIKYWNEGRLSPKPVVPRELKDIPGTSEWFKAEGPIDKIVISGGERMRG